jgi:hypothetical protein
MISRTQVAVFTIFLGVIAALAIIFVPVVSGEVRQTIAPVLCNTDETLQVVTEPFQGSRGTANEVLFYCLSSDEVRRDVSGVYVGFAVVVCFLLEGLGFALLPGNQSA